jgi:putative flippase GtrA
MRFVRFLIVGLVNAGAGYGIFLLLYSVFGLHYLVANILTFVIWSFPGFEIQRRWVFKSKQKLGAFLRFLSVQVFFLLFGTGLLYLGVELLRIDPELAYIAMVAVNTGLIYVSSRLIVFRD